MESPLKRIILVNRNLQGRIWSLIKKKRTIQQGAPKIILMRVVVTEAVCIHYKKLLTKPDKAKIRKH